MLLKIYKEIDILILNLADRICLIAEEAIHKRGQFNFVLSGGNSPKRLYELLATKAYRDRIYWNNTFFFFGDERFVPEDDTQRNSLMVQKALFDPLKIAESHIFKVNTSFSPEESASIYYSDIIAHFTGKVPKFDLILLGLGDNAHTASLFPHTSVLDESEASIKSVYVHELDSYRITMTAPLINQSRNIAFMVFGSNKADAVRQVIHNEGSIHDYPARLIGQSKKKLWWFLDESAASKLKSI